MRAMQKMTPFQPSIHGFKFNNNFTNDFIPQLDIRTDGLCGGMSFSALDYYFAKVPVPTQPFRPANGTPLHSWLYDRQVNSIVYNLDKWAEIGINPLGARDTEFFNWGLSAKPGERIDELRQKIDAGLPVVLGLQGDGKEGNHQIIAIGYDMGRYKGDLGDFKEDFKIFVCDPNYPGQIKALIPIVAKQVYGYADSSETWRTYFVDKKYDGKRPPVIASTSYPNDGLVHELALTFMTGGDDLRGGNDNVDLTVNLADGTQQVYRNINQGARWVVNNDETAEVVLQRPVKPDQIRNLVISTTFSGGVGSDNWDMTSVTVRTLGVGGFVTVKNAGPKRFTGSDKTLTVPISSVVAAPGQASKLSFTFHTTDDDLRGGNDNVNIAIHFRNGQMQRFENANNGANWANNSTHQVDVDLNQAVLPTDITQVDLQTTFGGGSGGDNWNMGSVSIQAVGNGVNQVLATHGYKRFTGSDAFLAIPIVVAVANQANRLQLTIRTGGDDMRGGNDNLNIAVHYRGGRIQNVANVNGSARWPDNTTHVVNINLDHATAPNDIVGLDLHTTFGGGMGGDNWNMDSMVANATGPGVNQQIFSHGYKRFTGSDGLLRLTRP
jgi:hypothetical protein